ncbi:variable surface protein [Plasmodium gonderi]|uniref:Variable surface protein n=1 Tax=Plasmodium gonderi TaxID=77519 RepID=A0A1Y1JXR8_PLAGO|nr:variable surface protein [Plasmodium gonderi]GAW84584.1 variable surface protein [Plasmodium gonderi]
MLNEDYIKLQKYYLSYCSTFPKNLDKWEQIKELCSKYLLRTLQIHDKKCISVFAEIQLMWSNFNTYSRNANSYRCKPNNSIISYYHIWEYAKKLYDYYIDFSYLDIITSNFIEKYENLCAYLNNITDKYWRFLGMIIFFTLHFTQMVLLSIMNYEVPNRIL